jgi:hypothetical protein
VLLDPEIGARNKRATTIKDSFFISYLLAYLPAYLPSAPVREVEVRVAQPSQAVEHPSLVFPETYRLGLPFAS